MNIENLRAEARNLGVLRTQHILSEQSLVRSIQKAQGHNQCFRSDQRFLCKHKNCRWQCDCKILIAEWMR